MTFISLGKNELESSNFVATFQMELPIWSLHYIDFIEFQSLRTESPGASVKSSITEEEINAKK